MKYHAKLPENNPNVSHQSPAKEFFTLLLGVVGVLLFVYWLLGFVIDEIVDHVSPEMEMAIFESIGQDLELQQNIDKSPAFIAAEKRMQALLADLLVCSDVGQPIRLVFQDSNTPNAFAAPGGNMVVLSGLLNYVESENGLAFVIAHEIGHFKNRDHLRGLGRGLVLMGLSFLATGNVHLSKILSPVNAFQNAQFSQGRESDADETALSIIQCHYGHVGGATEFFERIAEPQQDLSVAHYFRSHPEAQQRVKALQQLSQQNGFAVGRVKPAFWKVVSPRTHQTGE